MGLPALLASVLRPLARGWSNCLTAYFTGRAIWRTVLPPNGTPFATKRLALELTSRGQTVSWLCGPSRDIRTGEAYLSADRRCLKLADAADEIARIDAILRPLSLALPELRIRMHGDESTGMTPKGAPCGGWWHARCGNNWTDPVFF